MQKADLTTRAVAGFVDLLIIIALGRLPDIIGFLSASGYILARDGLFRGRSAGKQLIGVGLCRESGEGNGERITYRESIIRNTTFEAAYILFLIPYAGWVLGPAALVVEGLVALGDERAMRIGDMFARTRVVQLMPEGASPRSDSLPSTTARENQESIAIPSDQPADNEQQTHTVTDPQHAP